MPRRSAAAGVSARLLQAIPVAPLVADVRLSVTALSRNGALSVALLADPAITNLPTMAAGIGSVLDPASQQPGRPSHCRPLSAKPPRGPVSVSGRMPSAGGLTPIFAAGS